MAASTNTMPATRSGYVRANISAVSPPIDERDEDERAGQLRAILQHTEVTCRAANRRHARRSVAPAVAEAVVAAHPRARGQTLARTRRAERVAPARSTETSPSAPSDLRGRCTPDAAVVRRCPPSSLAAETRARPRHLRRPRTSGRQAPARRTLPATTAPPRAGSETSIAARASGSRSICVRASARATAPRRTRRAGGTPTITITA